MKKRTEYIITASLMALLIFGFSFWAWLKPADPYSESERRPLDSFPELSIKTLLNGSFMGDFEDYTLDQFPLRDTFRSIKAAMQYYIFNISDNNGLYVVDGQIVKLDFPINEGSVNYAADRFNDLYNSYMDGKVNNVVFTMALDKGYYLGAENGYPVMDYERMKEILESRLEFAEYCDIAELLTAEDYYNTDTHWKQESLTEAADKILGALNARPFDDLTEELATEKFHGVYYGQAALPLPYEDIRYLTNSEINGMTVMNYETNKETGVYDFPELESSDPYEFYLSGAASLLEVTNPSAEGDRHLIIFRDSFGSSMAPLLMRDYSKITLVDTRYIVPSMLGDYVDFEGADVLFLYSSLILNDSYVIRK